MEITDAAPEAAPAVISPPPAPQVPEAPPAPAAADVAAVADFIKEARRRPATLEELTGKKRRETDVVVASVDEDGEDVQLVLRYRAISDKEFDELMATCPPTPKQRADGMNYDPKTFGPVLVAAVCIEPKMTVEQAKALLDNPNWSTGEVATLTGMAMALCQTGAGVPFTVRG